MEHAFTWVSLIPIASDSETKQLLFTTMLVVAMLFFISRRITGSIKKSANPTIPEEKITTQNFFELIIQIIINIMKDIIGPSAEKYLPLIGGLFIYILFCNLLGVIPGFLPPTSNIYTNASCAIIVFFYYNYQGFKEHGMGYLKQFVGPLVWIAPLMIVVETLSHFFRPFSLSVRLFGNIFGDHTVLAIFSELVPLGVPVIFMGLALAVSLIQAFIFSALSAVYIGLAVSHDH